VCNVLSCYRLSCARYRSSHLLKESSRSCGRHNERDQRLAEDVTLAMPCATGSSPAGCKYGFINNLRLNFPSKINEFSALVCPNFALISQTRDCAGAQKLERCGCLRPGCRTRAFGPTQSRGPMASLRKSPDLAASHAISKLFEHG
jgi:hypothetical protein